MTGIYSLLNVRRGSVNQEEQSEFGRLRVECHLPVSESFGFVAALRQATGGSAFASMKFDHWSMLTGDPQKTGSKECAIILDVRKRKGRKVELPQLDEYLDKL
jgi:elongation factor 2